MSRRFVLVIVCLFLVVGFGAWLVTSKAKGDSKPTVSSVVQLPESEEQSKHIAYLQEKWQCAQRDDCWPETEFPTHLCRISQKFADIYGLYLSFTVVPEDPRDTALFVRADDPRMNVDLSRLKDILEMAGTVYIYRLRDIFKENVDEQTPILQCALRVNKPDADRGDLLDRIKEISESSGLLHKYPTDAEMEHMRTFLPAER